MLIYRRTSLFESPAQTLVNTVNCVGVMGKGLAHEFKLREPAMFKAYKRICDEKALEPGKLWLWRGQSSWVLNFPTKVHWKNASKIEWVEWGLQKFVSAYAAQGISEISFPRLGCGNGQLEWDDVRPLMEHYLSQVSIPVYIHDYTVDVGLPEHLETVAAALRRGKQEDQTYEGFVANIKKALEISRGDWATLGDFTKFQAEMKDDNNLSINISNETHTLEADDLRGVWLELQSGLVTERQAGWAARELGSPLLSILSALPNVRPLEIQRKGAVKAELAVEPIPSGRGAVVANQSKAQRELSWH
jgi:O-acetyl-ADP-ribose deacetylase (regulator of RNase III)